MAGYTKPSAAHELWGRLRVALAHRLHELLSDPARDVTRESYRDDLVALSHADPSDAFDDAGKLRPLSEWPKPLRRMVKRIKLGPFGQVEEVIFDGRASLMALLGKHKLVGAFDQVKVERRTYILRDYTGTSAPRLPAGAEGPPTTSPQAPAGAVPVLEAQVVASHPEIGDLDRGRIPVSGQPQRPAPASPAHGKR